MISKHANSASISKLFQPQFYGAITYHILKKLESGDIFSYEIPENLLRPAGNEIVLPSIETTVGETLFGLLTIRIKLNPP